MKYDTPKIKEESGQCSLCSAKLKIWLDNSELNEERKDRISQHLLSYCPACSRSGKE